MNTVTLYTLTVDDDSTVTTTVHATEQAAWDALRLNYFEGEPDVPSDNDGLLEFATETAGLCLWIDQHEVEIESL